MSAQPSPRSNPSPNAAPRPGSPNRGDGALARLTVAPEVARRRLRARLIMWGAALVTVASLFTLVAFHVFAAQSAFTLERLSKERTNEQLRYERLRLQVAMLSSPSVVIAESTKLGMVQGSTGIGLTVAPTASGAGASAAGGTSRSGSAIPPVTPSNENYSAAKRALSSTP